MWLSPKGSPIEHGAMMVGTGSIDGSANVIIIVNLIIVIVNIIIVNIILGGGRSSTPLCPTLSSRDKVSLFRRG